MTPGKKNNAPETLGKYDKTNRNFENTDKPRETEEDAQDIDEGDDTSAPVLDEEDLEENDLSNEEADDIEWEDENSSGEKESR